MSHQIPGAAPPSAPRPPKSLSRTQRVLIVSSAVVVFLVAFIASNVVLQNIAMYGISRLSGLPAPSKVPTPVPGAAPTRDPGAYDTPVELRDAAEEAGYTCGEWTPNTA